MKWRIDVETVLALVAVAWADGTLDPREAEGVRRAATALGLSAESLARVDEALRAPFSIDAVETVRMTRPVRLFTYAVACWIAGADGHLDDDERALLDRLGDRLGLSRVARSRAATLARERAVGVEPGSFDLPLLEQQLGEAIAELGVD